MRYIKTYESLSDINKLILFINNISYNFKELLKPHIKKDKNVTDIEIYDESKYDFMIECISNIKIINNKFII